jgi:DNA polymerase elongation subunit (family B)
MNATAYTQKWKSDNNNQLVIDIETMANPDATPLLPEPSIDSRLKDPVKIAEAKAEAKAKQIEKMALSPLTGKIAAVGLYGEFGGEVLIDDEKSMLDAVYAAIKVSQIITYNGKSFDIPFIFKRGIILGCEWATIPEMKLFTDRYKSGEAHIDLMVEFCNYGEYEKLDNLARFILGSQKVEFDYREIPELLKTDEGKAKITEYCLKDCELTYKLAKRMGF